MNIMQVSVLMVIHAAFRGRRDRLTCSTASYEQSEKKREQVNNCQYSQREREEEETEIQRHELKDELNCGTSAPITL